MKALITGITGFVGGHLARHLLDAGDEVLGVSQNGVWPAGFDLPVPLVRCDLADDLEPAFAASVEAFAPDVIFHLAALSIPLDCGATASEVGGEPNVAAWNMNVTGVERLLRLVDRLAKRSRVVFTSSSHVYGTVNVDRPVVDEESPCVPRTAYGRTKLAAEDLCYRAVREAEADVVVVRSFPQAGGRQDPRLVLAEWSQALAGDVPELLVGNDSVTVDLVDVRDAVRALRLLALHGASGSAYNVGSGTMRTTGELLSLLQRTAGDSRPVRARSHERRSDPVADIRRLQAATGWKPEIPIERTVEVVWNYWRERIRGTSD